MNGWLGERMGGSITHSCCNHYGFYFSRIDSILMYTIFIFLPISGGILINFVKLGTEHSIIVPKKTHIRRLRVLGFVFFLFCPIGPGTYNS